MIRFAGSFAWSKTTPVCKSVYPSISVLVSPSIKANLTMLATTLSVGVWDGLKDRGGEVVPEDGAWVEHTRQQSGKQTTSPTRFWNPVTAPIQHG